MGDEGSTPGWAAICTAAQPSYTRQSHVYPCRLRRNTTVIAPNTNSPPKANVSLEPYAPDY